MQTSIGNWIRRHVFQNWRSLEVILDHGGTWTLKEKQKKCSVFLRTFQQHYQSVLGEWPSFSKPVMISHYLGAAVGNILSMWMGLDLAGQQLKLVMDVGDLMGALSWQPFHCTHCFCPSSYDAITIFLLCIISDSLLKGKLKRLK